ncbi:hypothetical protein A5789_02445 [Nocardia sp. 852002-51101_SCH5132738]|nr:hypothetical protein A5789_02445 [Nocardia sp. 852002-51101_SCH5132738]OBB49123.1 hypothetical protein A5748_20290 [Nocardia sp. 852002-51244_SCH5132740]OBF82425.1 hypothetical protein A9X06_19270 [Mycobacterium sp. 852002-51759_SCH5129042]
MVVITRDEHGVFEARWGGERFVRGWSATAGEMVAILHRYGLVEPDLTAAGVSAAPVDASEGDRAGRLDGDCEEWHRLLRSRADGPQRARLREALVALRTQIPADRGELRMWLAERTEMVNAQAPQVDRVAVFQNGGPVRCDSGPEFPARSECLEWVDPRAIVSTVDRVWGSFDRSERNRRSLDAFCLSLCAADSGPKLEAWIDDFTIGRLHQPVQLVRVEGPAGCVYQLYADGTHRAHFARVFELPLMAWVKTSQLPRPVFVIDHPDRPGSDALGAGFGRVASLYMGLRARGLLEVDGAPKRPETMDVWQPTRVCAEWMLLPPVAAAAANRAYDRVYPGALVEATGLAAEQLYDPHGWARAVVQPPGRVFRARLWYENRKRRRLFEQMHGKQAARPILRNASLIGSWTPPNSAESNTQGHQ